MMQDQDLPKITGGGGTGAAATVTVNGSLDSVEVTAEGTGYTEQPLISIVGGGGSAIAQAVVTNGRVTRILVENPELDILHNYITTGGKGSRSTFL